MPGKSLTTVAVVTMNNFVIIVHIITLGHGGDSLSGLLPMIHFNHHSPLALSLFYVSELMESFAHKVF